MPSGGWRRLESQEKGFHLPVSLAGKRRLSTIRIIRRVISVRSLGGSVSSRTRESFPILGHSEMVTLVEEFD